MGLSAAKRGALFLDRDGVLNDLVFYDSSGEWESPRCRGDLRLLPNVGEALARLSNLGWPLILVSNQPSFAKGKTSFEDLLQVHAALVERLEPYGVEFRDVCYCYHHPDAVIPALRCRCDCRKPSPRPLRGVARIHDIDLAASWMIGDQDVDLLCGRSAGCGTILVPYPHSAPKRGAITPDLVCDGIDQVWASLT